MRWQAWLALAVMAVSAGCAGPHSTGALWAQQNLEQEAAMFRLSDAQRADQAHTFELGVADEALRNERARLEASLRDCPGGSRQPLALSPGDQVRDSIRVRAAGDPSRLAAVAQLALADWRVRRGRATGEARFCDLAGEALAKPAPSAEPGLGLMDRLGSATVARTARAMPEMGSGEGPLVDLSLYASGWAEAVRAPSPLPQYLAAVYGGQLVERPMAQADLGGRSAEELVDDLASGAPEWEPDALYAALQPS